MFAALRALRYLIFGTIACALVALYALYYAINTPNLQKHLTHYLNEKILHKFETTASLKSISINVFPLGLELHDVIFERSKQTKLCSANPCQSMLSVGTVDIGIAILSSYYKNEIVLSEIQVDNASARLEYSDDGTLILPVNFPTETNDSSEKSKSLETFRTIRDLLPEYIGVSNFQLQIGNPDASQSTKTPLSLATKIKSATWRAHGANDKDLIDLVLEKNILAIPASIGRQIPINLEIDEFSTIATIDNAGEVELRQFKFKSPDFKGNATGIFKLTNDIARFPGVLNLKTTASLRQILSFVDLNGAGNVSFDGSIHIAEKTAAMEITGKANWDHEARINSFALHGGNGTLHFANKLLSVTQLSISPKSGGKLSGEGTVDFSGNPVQAKIMGKVENISFATLMAGLDVPTDAAEFSMSSENLGVDFDIGNGGETFGITVSGPIAAQNIIIPTLHTPTRSPIHNCTGYLQLFSDYNHLDMEGTKLGCNSHATGKDDAAKGVVSLSHGWVDYNTGAVRFNLTGSNIEFSNVEYFLMDNPEFFKKNPTTGTMSLNGEIFSQNKNKPIVFTANLVGKDIRLYGMDYSSLNGNIRIDSDMIEGKQLKGTMGEENDGLVNLEHFYVKFDNEVNSLFSGNLQGNPQSILNGTQRIHEISKDNRKLVVGKLNPSPISVRGAFSPKPHATNHPQIPQTPLHETLAAILQWDIDANISFEQLTLEKANFKQFRARIFCKTQVCSRSKVRIEGPYIQQKSLTKGTPQIIADIAKFSLQESDIVTKIVNFPLQSFSNEQNLSGILSGTLNTYGPWQSWQTNSRLSIDDLSIVGNNLGHFQLNADTDNNNKLELRLEGLGGWLAARASFPRTLSGPSRAFLTLKEVPLDRFLPLQWRNKSDYQVIVNSDAIMEGPAPLTPLSQDQQWYQKWTVVGSLRDLLGQAKDFKFGLQSPAKFSFKNDTWEISNFIITQLSENGAQSLTRLEGNGRYNITTQETLAFTSLHLDLSALPKLFSQFGTSFGQIETSLQLSGIAPNLKWKGEGRIDKGAMLVQAFPPTIRNMDLAFSFNDSRIEIENFSGTKGDGKFEIAGAVDWSKMLTDDDELPALRLFANLSNTQTRIPIPVFQSIDTEVTGEVSVCRRSLCSEMGASQKNATNKKEEPIFISGNIELRDARVTRGLDCMSIVNAIPKSNEDLIEPNKTSIADRLLLNLTFSAPGTIALDTKCARTHLTAKELHIDGPSNNPQIMGHIETVDGTGTGQFSNIKFNIESAAIEFDGPFNNPRYNILLSTSVAGYREDKQRIDYKVFIQLDDRPLNKERKQPEIRAEPPLHPDGQRLLTQTDLVAMIITGRGPDASSPTSLSTEVVANQFATMGTNAIFAEARLESSVSRMFNRLSAGIVDRVAIDPLFESGRPKFRIRTIMEPVERVNINLETDQDPAGTNVSAKNASLNAQWILNNRINLGLDLSFQGEKVDTPLSMGAGILFRFGGD